MDKARADAFLLKMLGDVSAAAGVAGLYLADRCGLLAALADGASLTADDAAALAQIDARQGEELLAALAASGYLEYDADADSFRLPEEHAAPLADPENVRFLGGMFQMLVGSMAAAPQVAESLRTGAGVPFSAYGPDTVEGMARANAPTIKNLLTTRWIPKSARARDLLSEGARVLEIGCGSGHALVAIATAYPKAEIVGVDLDAASLAAATREVADAGLEDRVRLRHESVADLDEKGGFDVAISLDVIHDVSDPEGALGAIHESLDPGGVYLMGEPNMSAHIAENLNPVGAFFYSVSAMHCVPQSKAAGGPGLGAGWGIETAEQYARAAGFREVRQLEIENPFTALLELLP